MRCKVSGLIGISRFFGEWVSIFETTIARDYLILGRNINYLDF